MIVPQEIRNREFERGLNGYDQEEVVVFQQELAEEFENLYSQNERLKDTLRQIRAQSQMFKEAEGKLDQLLDLSRHKAAVLGEEAEGDAKHLLAYTHLRMKQTLGLHWEVIQRINAFSNEARSVLQEGHDFYGEKNPLFGSAVFQKEDGRATEMELLQARVDELLKGLDEYQESMGSYIPAAHEKITVESLTSQLTVDKPVEVEQEHATVESPIPRSLGKTPPETPAVDHVIVDDVLERTRLLIPPVKPAAPAQPQIRWEIPPTPVSDPFTIQHRKPKNKLKVNTRWVIILAVVMILGLVGGYCWRYDLIPPLPWVQTSAEPKAPVGGTEDPEGPSAPAAPTGKETVPPLLQAVMDQDLKKVEEILASGASPDAANPKGETPLMVAAYHGDSKIARALLEAGADPNIKEKEWGVTALMYASFKGNLTIVEMLLNKKADPDIRNREGWTALMCAAFDGHPKTVQLLIKKGADPYLKTVDGWTAYELALLTDRDLTVKAMENAGVTPEKIDESGQRFTANQDMLRLFDK
jgi:DivIVA domain-containing protein